MKNSTVIIAICCFAFLAVAAVLGGMLYGIRSTPPATANGPEVNTPATKPPPADTAPAPVAAAAPIAPADSVPVTPASLPPESPAATSSSVPSSSAPSMPAASAPGEMFGKKIKETLKGKVVKVVDGDSMEVAVDGKEIRVNLESVDAPEFQQPHGEEAKQALTELVADKDVEVLKTGGDRYGRTFGFVMVGGEDVGSKMLAQGHAWQSKKYSNDPALNDLQRTARNEKKGLWVEDDPKMPWVFRDENPGR